MGSHRVRHDWSDLAAAAAAVPVAKSFQSCSTFCNAMNCSPPGFSVHGISRQEYWSGLPFPSPWHLPKSGIEPEYPACVSHIGRWILYCLSHLGSIIFKKKKKKKNYDFFFFNCSGFCHTLKWISHGFTCVPHPDPPSHLPLHLIALGLRSAPGPRACLMHPTWAGDLLHPR